MRGRIVEISDSVRLRHATGDRLTKRVATIAAKAKARAAREEADLACIFIHEDLDGPEGSTGTAIHKQVTEAVTAAFTSGHYVLAVAEIEAWLLLFPDALSSYVTGWRLPRRYLGRDTGLISDPKRVIMKEISTSGRRYSESDAPLIFRRVVEAGDLTRPAGTNHAWRRFTDDVRKCCGSHLGSAPHHRRSGRVTN